jgi:hypothetical protein
MIAWVYSGSTSPARPGNASSGLVRQRSRLFISRDAAAVLLIVILWSRAIGSRIALSLTADKVFVPVGQDPIWPPAASIVSRGSYLLAIAICVGIILFRINDITRPGLWRIAVLLVPWLCILIRDLYSGGPTSDSVLYVLLVLALAALRPHPRVLIVLGALVALTAIVAVAFGFLMPDAGRVHDADGTLRSRPDKALFPALGLLQGMFTAENVLGLYLSVGVAAVAMLPRPWQRFSGLAIVVFAIGWSSSRSAMITTAAVLAVGVAVWAVTEFGWHRAASAIARLATFGAVVAMCVLPLMRWDDEAFTGRGVIWNGALAEWWSRGFFAGLGSDWFNTIALSDTSPLASGAFQGHNQLVQFLTMGGFIFAVLGVGSLLVQAIAITEPSSRYLAIAAMLVTGIAAGGVLEVPLGYVDAAASVYWTVTIVPLTVLFLACPGSTRRESSAR